MKFDKCLNLTWIRTIVSTLSLWKRNFGICPDSSFIIESFLFLRQKAKSGTPLKLRRLYFVWVCKHVQSFQWFVNLLHSTHNEVRFW